MSYYLCSLCGAQWQNMHTCAGREIRSTSAPKIPPVPNDPGTVCVRLDGLADKIAARLHVDRCASGCLAGPVDADRRIADAVVALLQSLAVQ